MDIINLTPHVVVVYNGEGIIATIAPEGTVARCVQSTTPTGTANLGGIEIPLSSNSFGEVSGLPAPAPDTIYVVSALVAAAAKAQGRTDVRFPAEPVRDGDGKVIGCRSLGI